ncbi:MAG: hypothetical protein K6E37_00560 [Bacteroidales bacterium]|nr:hypothetical protein [Bacteroidales bacterium]
MKRIYVLMLAAACAICLAGCVKEILGADEAIAPATEMIICGTMGDLVEDGAQATTDTPDTRTQVRNTKEVWWIYTDRIAVFMSTSTTASEFTSTLTSGMSKTSYFSGTLKKTGSKYYVGYPSGGAEYSTSSDGTLSLRVPSSQTAVSGSFSSNTLPSYGSFTSSSKNFTMKPAAGGLKFHVSRDDIKIVKFEGNNGEKVAGKVTVAKLSKTPDISRSSSGGSTSITLKRSSGNLEKDKNYFIVITPGSLSKGFTITLTTEGGESLVVTSTKSRTIKAGVFGTLSKALDEYAEQTSEAIDLGLPSGTKWATFNLGATKPEGYGDYFAWGETAAKSDYSWSNYALCNDDKTTLKRYNTSSDYGSTVDYKSVLNATDDAASVIWGNNWRTPTYAEWMELESNCTWTWTDDYNQTGIKGEVVTGSNGNSIFLPSAGYMEDANLYEDGSHGNYWASSLYTRNPIEAFRVYFYPDDMGMGTSSRYFGFSIRPVYGKLVPVTGVSLPGETIQVGIGKRASYQITFTPSNATDKSITVKIADKSIASFTYNTTTGIITLDGLASGTTTMTVYASSGVSATCEIKVAIEPEYVDLGLPSGTKWAKWNVGANKPEEYGEYFAWGETEANSDYDWSTYKYCNGSKTTLTKYNTSIEYGSVVDYKSVLDPEDDAASANWGEQWRTPTRAELTELHDSCTWTWTDNYNGTGIAGQVVTGSNGNFIFLPASGLRSGTELFNVGSGSTFWASSIDVDSPVSAWLIAFNSSGARVYGNYRGAGFSIRPVYGKLVPVTGVSLSEENIHVTAGQSFSCQVTLSPSNATETTLKVVLDRNVALYHYYPDTNILSVTGVEAGTTTMTVYGSSGVSASCQVTVTGRPEYVDLGLSVKWATFNIGASAPDGYGNYYAWGEKDAKSSFSWSNHLWGGSASTISKYNLLSSNGTVDHKRTLDLDDDAARAEWGGDWRLPTLEEFSELRNTSNCTWTWTTQGGRYGYKVTSKKSGHTDKSIFLPAAGSYDGSSVSGTGSYVRYWTSTPNSSDYSKSNALTAQQSSVGFSTLNRYLGLPIRPVYGSFTPVNGLTVDTYITVKVGTTASINVKFSPSHPSDKSLEVISSDSSVATYASGMVKGVGIGTATLTFYTHNGISATCKVSVIKEPEYVDLGLPSGLKWAKWNVGANKPEEYGDYFSWGETEPKKSYYFSTYKFGLGGTTANGPYSKYVNDSKYGTVDNKLVLDPEDDAAHVNWGGNWRMPTDEEWKELKENCSWEWTSDYNGTGVAGRIVTGKVSGYENKSIFLPAAGYMWSTDLKDLGSIGYYWSSSLFTERSGSAWRLFFSSTGVSRYSYGRTSGHSIRPVKK